MAHTNFGSSDHSSRPIVQFSVTERNAEKWADDHCWDLDCESTYQLNQVLSKLSGPTKQIPFKYESYGAMIRGIEAPILKGLDWTPWRQPLVDFIVAYRQVFNNSYHNGGGAPVSLLVNFHELDASLRSLNFDDEPGLHD